MVSPLYSDLQLGIHVIYESRKSSSSFAPHMGYHINCGPWYMISNIPHTYNNFMFTDLSIPHVASDIRKSFFHCDSSTYILFVCLFVLLSVLFS